MAKEINPKYLTETYLKTYAENQIEKYLSAGPVDEKFAEQHLRNAYKVAKLEEPKTIIWYDSPREWVEYIVEAATRNGDSVRASVGASVWASVWASVRDSVRASVGASVRDSVRDSVRASVGASVWASVWASVGASVWDSVRDSVRASVGASVWASVWASVRDSVWDSVRAWDNSGYDSWLQYFNDCQEENDFRHICMFGEMVNGWYLTAETAHIIRKPIFLSRGTDGTLDNDQRMAIEWADGFGFYYLRGEEFTKDLWEKIISQDMKLKDVMSIKNADKRAVAFQMLKPDRLLKAVDAKLIHTGIKGTRLFQVEKFAEKVLGSDWRNSGIENKTEYCMVMDCLTGRIFLEWVDPEIGKLKDADTAQAHAFGIAREDYLAIELEG